jgi:FKBP-type peptidyl-prolyl cis-trans isomerase FkpA/FKBP-type peptidyl-prolyl cis-trans isomerase FklB
MTIRILRSLAVVLLAALPAAAAALEPTSEEEKTLYALGVALSRNLGPFALTEKEMEWVKAGMGDGARGKPKVDMQVYAQKVQEMARTRMAAAAEAEKKAGQAFQTKAAAEKGATKTASGLIVTTLKPGTGPSPAANDRVKVHYHGTLIDGTVFDSSVQRGEPATFPLNGVIKCWTEGVALMKVGGKSKLVCPPEIAYGDRGSPPRIRPGSTLVFEVELLEIVK